jgi:hypothetical protein
MRRARFTTCDRPKVAPFVAREGLATTDSELVDEQVEPVRNN